MDYKNKYEEMLKEYKLKFAQISEDLRESRYSICLHDNCYRVAFTEYTPHCEDCEVYYCFQHSLVCISCQNKVCMSCAYPGEKCNSRYKMCGVCCQKQHRCAECEDILCEKSRIPLEDASLCINCTCDISGISFDIVKNIISSYLKKK
jgi:hypothetical protein